MDRNTYLANKQAHPKRPIKYWSVKVGRETYFQNESVALCYHYIRTHALNVSPIAVY